VTLKPTIFDYKLSDHTIFYELENQRQIHFMCIKIEDLSISIQVFTTLQRMESLQNKVMILHLNSETLYIYLKYITLQKNYQNIITEFTELMESENLMDELEILPSVKFEDDFFFSVFEKKIFDIILNYDKKKKKLSLKSTENAETVFVSSYIITNITHLKNSYLEIRNFLKSSNLHGFFYLSNRNKHQKIKLNLLIFSKSYEEYSNFENLFYSSEKLQSSLQRFHFPIQDFTNSLQKSHIYNSRTIKIKDFELLMENIQEEKKRTISNIVYSSKTSYKQKICEFLAKENFQFHLNNDVITLYEENIVLFFPESLDIALIHKKIKFYYPKIKTMILILKNQNDFSFLIDHTKVTTLKKIILMHESQYPDLVKIIRNDNQEIIIQ